MAVSNLGLRGAPFLPEEDQRLKDLEAAFAGTGIAGPAADVAAMTGTIVSGFTASSAGTLVAALSTSDTYTDAALNAKITALNQLISNVTQKQNAILSALKAAGVMT